MAVYEEEVIDYFTIAQNVGTNQHYEAVNDYLGFSQNGDEIDLHAHMVDTLTYVETLSYTLSTHKFITDHLVFTDKAQRIKEGSVYQNLVMTQSTGEGAKQWQLPDQTIVFSETVVIEVPKATFDLLTFSETVRLNYNKPIVVSQTLVFTDFALAYLETERFIAVPVDEVVASVPPAYTPGGPSSAPYSLVTHTQRHVTLSGGPLSLILPAPDFGNTESVGETRIQRQTRGGDFIVWRDAMWPIEREFEMTFSFLSASQVSKLQSFVAKTCGQLISFTDHYGLVFRCVITSPEVEVSNPSRMLVAKVKLLVVRTEDA